MACNSLNIKCTKRIFLSVICCFDNSCLTQVSGQNVICIQYIPARGAERLQRTSKVLDDFNRETEMYINSLRGEHYKLHVRAKMVSQEKG